MKIIISEQQKLRLVEQSSYERNIMDRSTKMLDRMSDLNPHTLTTVLGIGTAFIPVIGPFISASIGLADAALYYKEGDKNSAGLTAAFSMLPFIGTVVSRIPGVKQLGSKGMAALSAKLSSKAKLSKTEIDLVEKIKSQEKLIRNELKNASEIVTELQKTITQYKQTYITKFGQQKYDDLLNSLLSKKLTKEQFTAMLKSSSANTNKLADWSVKSGIKFLEKEMKALSSIVSYVRKGTPTNLQMTLNVQGVPRKILIKLDHFPNKSFKGRAINNNKIEINLSVLKNKTDEEIKQVLFHEAGHIKDPSVVSKVYQKTYKEIQDKRNELGRVFDDLFDQYKKTGEGLDDVKKASQKFKEMFDKYKFHPQEILANNQMVLNNMTDYIKDLISQKGAKETEKILNNFLEYLSGKKDLNVQINNLLGEMGVEHLLSLGAYNKKYYQNFLTKIAKQTEYLKSQLNLLSK